MIYSSILFFRAYLFPFSGNDADSLHLLLMMHNAIAGAILASIVIFLYDGTCENIKGAVAKNCFQAFSALHMLFIWLVIL